MQVAVADSYRGELDRVRSSIGVMEKEASERHQLVETVRRQGLVCEENNTTISGLILTNSRGYNRLVFSHICYCLLHFICIV